MFNARSSYQVNVILILCSDISLRTRPTWFTWSREQRLATSSWSPSSEQWRQELKPVVYPSITTYTELNLSFLQKEFMPFIIKIINSSFMLNVVLMVLHFICRHHLHLAWREGPSIFLFLFYRVSNIHIHKYLSLLKVMCSVAFMSNAYLWNKIAFPFKW